MSSEDAAAVGRQIAYRIRAELVCCKVFQRVQDGEVSMGRMGGSHVLCYWGEASARIAETPEQWQDDPTDWDWSTPDVVERRKGRGRRGQEDAR